MNQLLTKIRKLVRDMPDDEALRLIFSPDEKFPHHNVWHYYCRSMGLKARVCKRNGTVYLWQEYTAPTVREQQIIEIYKLHPDWTLQNIGDHFKLTRERIRLVLLANQLRTKKSWRKDYFCSDCGAKLNIRRKRCPQCRKQVSWLICNTCNNIFERSNHIIRETLKKGYKHTFCGKHCQGKWLGKHYRRGVKKRKGV